MAQNLGHPIALAEGGCISTVDEALNFYFSLPARERTEWHWTEAAKLLVSTLEESDDLERAETQFRLALAHLAN